VGRYDGAMRGRKKAEFSFLTVDNSINAML
jgi:hypothetical protein